jgi:hypothetical protein
MSQPPPLATPLDGVRADGVQLDGEVLHPRRTKLVLALLLLVAMAVGILIEQPSPTLVVCGVVLALASPVLAVSLIPGATFLSIRPDALQVRYLYRDTYFRWDSIGFFNVHESTFKYLGMKSWTLKRIVWDYSGADVGGRPSWVQDWFGDPERLAARLNAYCDIYSPDRRYEAFSQGDGSWRLVLTR